MKDSEEVKKTLELVDQAMLDAQAHLMDAETCLNHVLQNKDSLMSIAQSLIALGLVARGILALTGKQMEREEM